MASAAVKNLGFIRFLIRDDRVQLPINNSESGCMGIGASKRPLVFVCRAVKDVFKNVLPTFQNASGKVWLMGRNGGQSWLLVENGDCQCLGV